MVASLMEAFINANVRLEYLSLDGFKIDALAIQSLTKFKSLNELVLIDNGSFLEEDLILLARELPLLSVAITLDGLIKLAQTGKQLKDIILYKVTNFRINQNGFDSLLNAVKSCQPNRKLWIHISGSGFDGDVKRSMQKQLKFVIFYIGTFFA